MGREGDEKNAIKKKLNILKIYIYRFVFTSSPQIKSSKSTLSKAAGRRGEDQGEEENAKSGSLQPKSPWRSMGTERQGRAGGPNSLPSAQAQLFQELKGAEGGGVREEAPISPSWLPEGQGQGQGQGSFDPDRGRHRANQRSPKRLERGPQTLPRRGTPCPVPEKACEWEVDTVPSGKLILRANIEPGWQGV